MVKGAIGSQDEIKEELQNIINVERRNVDKLKDHHKAIDDAIAYNQPPDVINGLLELGSTIVPTKVTVRRKSVEI